MDGMTEPIDELAMTPESQQSAGESISHYKQAVQGGRRRP